MQRIALQEGLSFSRIVHGMWRLADWKWSAVETLAFVENCVDKGVTTFDHADIYGDYTCEGLFGNALALSPSIREKIEIVTKTGIKLTGNHNSLQKINYYDTSKKHIIAQVERSLKELQTDYIDTLLIHRPDPLMDPDEIASAFITLKEAGKVRAFGVSNHIPSQQALVQSRLPFPLVTNQLELSPIELKHFSDGAVDYCYEQKIPLMAWSPLAGGRLFSEANFAPLRTTLEELQLSYNAPTMESIAYAWLLKHPATILPIVGSSKLDRVQSAIDATSISLTREDWFRVLRASRGRDVD